jgi:hypothetical protein
MEIGGVQRVGEGKNEKELHNTYGFSLGIMKMVWSLIELLVA